MPTGVHERRFTVSAGQSIQLGDFWARQVLVQNVLPSWIYLRIGGTDIPTGVNCDIPVAPFSTQIIPITSSNLFGVGVGPAIVTLGQQVATGQAAIITFYDDAKPTAIGSIDLNPSRLTQMTQQKFVAASSYTIAFPATTVHVANYSPAWVYVKFGSLVIPTAAMADVSIPPMSEKSLTCLPNTQFAFGLSANLVTQGQQVPAGVQIIATFFEYPTPISVGTADLNPSKMGQMVQQKFVVASSYTIAFPATTVHVANYSLAWLYVRFGSLVVPTVSTADVAVPPMTEKSLTCLPNTQFAFGFGSNLVTQGQQMPTGTQVIATFFEYPTAISVGTADLNPTRLGKSASEIITANRPIDPAFPTSQINISNYLQYWIYASYSFTNLIQNGDFESWTAGLPTSWAGSLGGGGSITQVVGYRGSWGVRITKGAVWAYDYLVQGRPCQSNTRYTITFWVHGDGVNAGWLEVWDNTGGAAVVPWTSTGITGLAWQPFSLSFTTPAGCLSISVLFGMTPGQPNGAFSEFDVVTLQLETTAANAQIAVPPLSEKSVTLPPSSHFDIALGAQTVMVATSVPVTQAVTTLYEYPVATSLGIAPLSPGGFRYREVLGTAQVLTVFSTFARDLSNFSHGRYFFWLRGLAVANSAVRVVIYDTTMVTNDIARSVWLDQLGTVATLEFDAGRQVTISFQMDGGPANFTVDHMLEGF